VAGTYCVNGDAAPMAVELLAHDGETARLSVNGRTITLVHQDDGPTIRLATHTQTLELSNLAARIRPKQAAGGHGALLAPMHGRLVEICVAEGAVVKKGDRLAVLEAMKMQHELVAGIDGVVARITAAAGMQIAANTLVLEIEPAGAVS
jgi:geranyl-CoA carboxylase alpha subunit